MQKPPKIIQHPIIRWNDSMYLVKDTVRESHNPPVEDYKKYVGATNVLKRDGWFWFVEEIEETPFEEIEEKTVELEVTASKN